MIEELIELIIFQQEEINRLNETIDRIKKYIEVYEDYLEGFDR